MQIQFFGAARTVTGSKHLIQTNQGIQILLDCGLFQGMGKYTDSLNEDFDFLPAEIDILLLSHAHIDHCGLLPRLVANGFKGTIYCTAATMDLARILMLDSAGIQEQDALYLNKHIRPGEPLHEPLYKEEDVIQTLGLMKLIEYDEVLQIAENVQVRFTDAGHLVGSAAIHLEIEEDGKVYKISFSGDVGRYDDLLLSPPAVFPPCDYLIMESTYGNSLHKDIEPFEEAILEIIQDTCVRRGGKVIIPAFSVGRTQEVLFALNNLYNQGKLPDVPVIVDSPLALEATQVLDKHTNLYNAKVKHILRNDQDIFQFPGLRFVQHRQESMALNTNPDPMVIISSSGMAEAGRVRHHIRNNISNANSTILMVGYCETHSLAGRLKAGEKQVEIFNEFYNVLAEVRSISSMSAHGDYQDLMRFVSCQKPDTLKAIYLVHGEYETQQAFQKHLHEAGYKNVEIPAFKEIVKI
ncbi:MAG: MBL fold metallo-hydrolase [Pedobacter sp.]|nr:MAG: MBL fold metallo-hydrolase [Pedobacter sp.]